MWDFYNSHVHPGATATATTSTSPSSSSSRPQPSSAVLTQVTEQSSKISSNKKRSRAHDQVDFSTHHYENLQQVPDPREESRSRSPRSNLSFSSGSPSPPPSQSFSTFSSAPRVPDRDWDHPYANVELTMPLAKTRLPGKMPPLSVPKDPRLRPPIPPKPSGIRFSPGGYVANLRTDKNLTLPVRVVYETFI